MRRRRTKSEEEKVLTDEAYLLRSWRAWHREILAEALAGPHAELMQGLMARLENMPSAAELVDFVTQQDWSAIDDDTRFIALFETSTTIAKHREKQGLDPFSDPLPHQPPNAFLLIKQILFPSQAGEPSPATARLPGTHEAVK